MNVSVTKVTTTTGGSLVEKTNKEDIKNTIIEAFCDIFNSTNHTPIRNPDTVRKLGRVGGKEESKNILNVT